MDCSPPGSSILGIFQARVLEWGAIAFSTKKTAVNLNIDVDIFKVYMVLPFSLSKRMEVCVKLSHPHLVCGEGNGTPLQYSCLANPMDRGAWQSTV